MFVQQDSNANYSRSPGETYKNEAVNESASPVSLRRDEAQQPGRPEGGSLHQRAAPHPPARRLHGVQLLVALHRAVARRRARARHPGLLRRRGGIRRERWQCRSGVRRGEGRVGARPGRALLHQRDVPADRRPAGLHEVRQARDPVHPPVAVAAPRLRPPPLRRRRLPPPRPRQVHGLRRGLRRAQPHAVAHVPPRQGGAPAGDRAQGLRALHAQVPLPGARLHGVRVLDAVPGAVEPDARRRAAVHGPAQRVPGRAGPGVEQRRRWLRLRRPQRRQVVHPPRRALRGRPPPRLRQRRRLRGQAQRHHRGAGLRGARVVPDRAPGARRIPRQGGGPDGGAPALREWQVVRRRELPEDAAHAERRNQAAGHRGRVPRCAGGGVPGRVGGGGGGEVRADGRERDDADEGRRAPRAVRALAAREGRVRHRLRALVLARPRRCLERAGAPFADLICIQLIFLRRNCSCTNRSDLDAACYNARACVVYHLSISNGPSKRG